MRKAKGRVAQMVEHLTFNQVVPGSSPGALTSKINDLAKVELAGQVIRVNYGVNRRA